MSPLTREQQPHSDISQVCVQRRYQRHPGRFQRSTLGLGEFSWTAGLSETLIIRDQALTEFHQWWDAMQQVSSRVNRPIGWGFGGITNGEIRYMKLWQVSVDDNCLCHESFSNFPLPACSLEFWYQRQQHIRSQQQDNSDLKQQGALAELLSERVGLSVIWAGRTIQHVSH